MLQRILILVILVISLGSCQNNGVKKSLLPGVSGSAGEVLVVMDKPFWKGELGQEFKRLLLQDVPGLPQSEPIFNPVNISRKAFSQIFRIHRNIIIIQINEEIEKNKVSINYDIWAQPQLVIKLNARNKTEALNLLKENEDKIAGLLFKAERDRLMSNYKQYAEKNVMEALKLSTGVKLTIPKGYSYDLDTNNFVWISQETPEISQGLFIYSYPFTDDSTFTLKYQIEKRNEILKMYVAGETPDTYMTTENQVPSSFKAYDWKGKYTAEIRGLWKVHGDFMGGPFMSLSRVNEKTNQVITVEGYAYAPKYNKRNYMRQLEAILYSFEFSE